MSTTLGGLLLALASAATINLGFLLQHRGLHAHSGSIWRVIRGAIRTPVWLGGQLLGWVGFAAQITAVSIAPLALVQSFAAGGLVLSVPLAAGLFGHRVSRRQGVAVALTAAGLAALPAGLPHVAEQLHDGPLVASMVLLGAAGVVAGLPRSAPLRALAAGLLYGVADAGIKAVAVRWGHAGAASLLSGWAAAAALGTLGGFVTFQAALRGGGAVPAITLMNVFAALVGLGCGVAGFGESLGRDGTVVAAHLFAIALVLACVPTLAQAHEQIAAETARQSRPEREQPAFEPRAGAG